MQTILSRILIFCAPLIGLVTSNSTHDDVTITKLKVPLHAAYGDDAELYCDYESPVQMYSIKWYRNDTEFFYYIPSLKPSKRTLNMAGIKVDVQTSTGRRVVLREVNLDSEGRFKCEVSTEWPHYYTADKSEYMAVVVLPKEKPEIAGANDHYRLGELVELTCTSAPSKPKAKISWFINEGEVSQEMVEDSSPAEVAVEDSRLQSSCLKLKFVVRQRHFRNGRLTIRCSAVIPSLLYHESWRHAVFEEIAFNVPVFDLEEKAALSGRTNAAGRVALAPEYEAISLLLPLSLLNWRNLRNVT